MFKILSRRVGQIIKLQQNSNTSSREDYIPQILTVLLEILRVYIWASWPFVFCLSFVNNSWNNVTTPSTNERFWPDSGQILRHQYGISVAESQTFLLAKSPQRRRARRNGCFRRLTMLSLAARAARAACAMVAQNISHLLWYKIATTKRTKAKRIVKPNRIEWNTLILVGILNLSTSPRNKHHKRGDWWQKNLL